MNSGFPKPTNPLITKIHQLFNRDLAQENDYLRLQNMILRSKLGHRIPLTEVDRRILVKYGLRIKHRLREIMAIAKPETVVAWNRRQKKKKWTFQAKPQRPGRPRKWSDTESLVVKLAETRNRDRQFGSCLTSGASSCYRAFRIIPPQLTDRTSPKHSTRFAFSSLFGEFSHPISQGTAACTMRSES